jgi:small-conductance mechanosensitive channel
MGGERPPSPNHLKEDAMNISELTRQILDWLLTSGLRVAAILVVAWIAVRLASSFSSRVLSRVQRNTSDVEQGKRLDTLSSILRYLLMVVIVTVAALMTSREFGMEIGPVLATAGVLGLAVGFGAQSLVKDLISGFFILLYDQVRVGDVVEIAGKGGLVEGITLKMITLRDLAGNVHYVPNGEVTVVTNMTKGYSRYVFDIGVAYREDVDHVIEVVKEVDADLRKDPTFADDILEPIEILGLDAFADSAVIVKARTKTPPIKQWRVAREFNRRLKKRFDELNIEIPFPHVTLYMGADRNGAAPPLRVEQVAQMAGR